MSVLRPAAPRCPSPSSPSSSNNEHRTGATDADRLQIKTLDLARTALPLPPVLGLCRGGRLPLQVGDRVGSAARQRHDAILDVAGQAPPSMPPAACGSSAITPASPSAAPLPPI